MESSQPPRLAYQPPTVRSVKVFLPMLAATSGVPHVKKPFPIHR